MTKTKTKGSKATGKPGCDNCGELSERIETNPDCEQEDGSKKEGYTMYCAICNQESSWQSKKR